jgi:hypothetical protein
MFLPPRHEHENPPSTLHLPDPPTRGGLGSRSEAAQPREAIAGELARGVASWLRHWFKNQWRPRGSSYFRGAEASAVPTANIATIMAEKTILALTSTLGSDHSQARSATEGVQSSS